MQIILNNLPWMTTNILLALLPVYAGFILTQTKNIFFKILFGMIWLAFVPNTIYILTDLIHLPRQLSRIPHGVAPLLFLEYFLLVFVGIVCFILAIYPVERYVMSSLKKYRLKSIHFIISLNFLIAFGVTLGRFQRTNSWELLTNFSRVVEDIIQTLTTPLMLLFIILFGVTANLIYYLFRDSIKAEVVMLLKKKKFL
jgi:uncharacterized membrane protein